MTFGLDYCAVEMMSAGAAGQDPPREHHRARVSTMTSRLDTLQAALQSILGPSIRRLVRDRGEITITVGADDYLGAARTLRDHSELKFEQLVDLCGVDYST